MTTSHRTQPDFRDVKIFFKKVLTLESMISNIAEYGVNLAVKQQKLTLLTEAEKEFVGGRVHRISAGDLGLGARRDGPPGAQLS